MVKCLKLVLFQSSDMVIIVSPVDVVLSRRSIRRYKKKEIHKDGLNKILEAGRLAPSAANR